MAKPDAKTEVEELREDVAALKRDIAGLVRGAKDKAVAETTEWGKDHVAATLGIAAGIGFVLGLMVRGRKG